MIRPRRPRYDGYKAEAVKAHVRNPLLRSAAQAFIKTVKDETKDNPDIKDVVYELLREEL